MILLFDLDGTVCDHKPGTNPDDGASLLAGCTPRRRALERIHELAAMGHGIGFVTARGPHVADITKAQLRSWLGPLATQVVVRHRPRLLWDYAHWVPDKERSIRELHGDVYVGDRPEDRAAALRAGAQFLWDHEFEAHGLAALRTVAAA